MIEEADALETIAEISAAIAGFAMLAGTLGRDAEHRGRAYIGLRVVITSSLLVYLLSALVQTAVISVLLLDQTFSSRS